MSSVKELKFYAKDLSILVVEDDVMLNEQIVEIVSLFFKKVYFAFNGEEALKMYKQNPVDILLTDVTMPKMDGVELSKHIKYIDDKISIIMVSAHCHLDYLSNIIDIGIKQFIRKPYEDEDLLYRLLKVCEDIVLQKSIHIFNEDLTSKGGKFTKKVIKQKVEPIIEPKIQKTDFKLKDITNAGDFLQNISYDIEKDIEYILELVEELEEYIQLVYINKANSEYIRAISTILSKIHTTLSQMGGAMNAMSLVIFDLASFLDKIDFASLNDEQKNKLNMLEFIYDDISKFVNIVFVEEKTINIHYLEDSLRSSIKQLEQNIFNVEVEEEDFELF
jgi:YesN/AraC family two-component response regulator